MKRLIKFLRDMDAGSAETILNSTRRCKSRSYLIEGVPHYDGTESDDGSSYVEEKLDNDCVEEEEEEILPEEPMEIEIIAPPTPPKEKSPSPPPSPPTPKEKSPSPELEGWRLREQQRKEAKTRAEAEEL